MHHRPPLRAGHGNRRRRPPAQAAARRHFRWLLAQFRRLGHAVRRLPQLARDQLARPSAPVADRSDAAPPRDRIPLKKLLADTGDVVATRGRALAPAARRAIARLGTRLDRGAVGLGHTAGHARRGARRLGDLTVRGLAQIGRATERTGRALTRLARRTALATARLTLAAARGVWHRRALVGAFAQRLAWWGALALLWFGGRAMIDLRTPLIEAAFPLFLVGLALCLPLFFARAARLRWGGLALGLGHAALAVTVWTLTVPA